ncbi:MAG TPA: NADH-quinone oxidoreductase subunit NuoE [Methanosarcinales archaeon]|nr:NADH-quinone oxidoreductase subunit NuoE [Methanosarcinales archaeon]
MKKEQEDVDIDAIDSIIERHNVDVELLISILQDVQSEYNYLPADALRRVAERLQVPLIQVYSVATFFKAFSLVPRGRHSIHVCLGTACHVRGVQQVLGQIERDLEVKAGGTTDDGEFTLETVNCLGACALGPIVMVDDEYHGQMTPEKVRNLLKTV